MATPTTFSGLVNYMRGKNLLDRDPVVAALIEKCDAIERALDDMDNTDYFGTEGWRFGILGED